MQAAARCPSPPPPLTFPSPSFPSASRSRLSPLPLPLPSYARQRTAECCSQVEQQQEKEDLLHTVRELTRQLNLQNLVIDAFVPPEELSKLERRAVWDEDGSEEWRLLPRSEGEPCRRPNRPLFVTALPTSCPLQLPSPPPVSCNSPPHILSVATPLPTSWQLPPLVSCHSPPNLLSVATLLSTYPHPSIACLSSTIHPLRSPALSP